MANIGSLAGPHDHAATPSRDGNTAAFDEHPKHVIAGPCEEARATNCDQPESAADLYRDGSAARRPLQKHRAGVKNNLAACIYEIAIDCEPRPFAHLERGVSAKTHGQPRVRPGANSLGCSGSAGENSCKSPNRKADEPASVS